MIPGMGGMEMLVIAVLALVVVGPKDLPVLLRRLGKFTGKVRNMANEFRASFDEMARQSELDELRKEVEALRTGQPLKAAAGLEGEGGVQAVFDDIHASLRDSQAQMHPITSPQYPSSGEASPEPATPEPVAPENASAVRADP